MPFLWCISMLIIGQFLMLLSVQIHGQDQSQTKNIVQLADFVGVKLPNEIIQISTYMTDYKGLDVRVQPNNEIRICSAEPNYRGNASFHFLSKTSNKLTFSVRNYGHNFEDLPIIFNLCQKELEVSLGDTCGFEAFKEYAIEWDIACYNSSSKWQRLNPAPQNQHGFKLEHMESDRLAIQGLDKEVGGRGYSTYSILHVTFGPTQEAICNFQVIMNSQHPVVAHSTSRKGNRDNILLLPRDKVPEEYRVEVELSPLQYTTTTAMTSIPSTTPSGIPYTSTVGPNERWTFPPDNEKVFGFMDNLI